MTMTSSDRKVEEESQTDNEDGDEDEDGDGNYHKNQLTRFHSIENTENDAFKMFFKDKIFNVNHGFGSRLRFDK